MPANGPVSALTLPPGFSPAMTAGEVCTLLRVSPAHLRVLSKKGKIPAPVWRGGRGGIWRGVDVARHLGLLPPEFDDAAMNRQDDPFAMGARKLGHP